MLRSLLIGLGGLCFGGGLIALLAEQWPGGFGVAIFGGLLLLGTVWERFRYKPLESRAPGPGFVPTDERFIDDETGMPVRVYLEPQTGERRYVRE